MLKEKVLSVRWTNRKMDKHREIEKHRKMDISMSAQQL